MIQTDKQAHTPGPWQGISWENGPTCWRPARRPRPIYEMLEHATGVEHGVLKTLRTAIAKALLAPTLTRLDNTKRL